MSAPLTVAAEAAHVSRACPVSAEADLPDLLTYLDVLCRLLSVAVTLANLADLPGMTAGLEAERLACRRIRQWVRSRLEVRP